MSSIWNDIIKAVNDHLERKTEGALCSLQLFDTGGLDYLFKYNPNPVLIDKANFQPRGSTPLRDAIMYGVETLSCDWGDTLRAEGIEVEFTIFTDGEENSSTFWKSADVARAITHFQEQYGWTFSFIGAGSQSDVAKYARQFGIKTENVVAYASSDQLQSAFAQV